MKHKTIKWKCKKCNSVQKSSSKERHKMDTCECGASSVDLEQYYSRFMGVPEVLLINDDLPTFQKISIYKEVLKHFAWWKLRTPMGICGAIVRAITDKKGVVNIFHAAMMLDMASCNIPADRPKNLGSYWWKPYKRKPRRKFIKARIAQLEKEIENEKEFV